MRIRNWKPFLTLSLAGVLLLNTIGIPVATKAAEDAKVVDTTGAAHSAALMGNGDLYYWNRITRLKAKKKRNPTTAYKDFHLGDSSWIGGKQEIKKSGKYYFKYLPKEHAVGISKKRDGKFKKTPMEEQFFANDKQAYYMIAETIYKKYAIYKYVFHTGKSHKVKTLPSYAESNEGVRWDIGAVYQNKIFIQRGNSYDGEISGVYTYDINTQKINKTKQKWGLMGQNGKYVLTHESYATDTSTYPISLYQLGKSGMRKVKTLTKKGFGAWLCGKYIYYTDYGDSDYLEKVSLYRCTLNGKNGKTMASFSLKEDAVEGSTCIVGAATEAYCYVVMPDGVYRYTYSSKKMTFFDD